MQNTDHYKTHKPGVYEHWDIKHTMEPGVINVYNKLKGFLTANIVALT